MEARLAALQTASTHTHTHLTRVRLALVNIYSVARAYQHSLTALGPKAPTATVLKRLHNFLLDAMIVTTTARAATHPTSLRPSACSVAKPIGKGNIPLLKKDIQHDSGGSRRGVSKRHGIQSVREESKRAMKIEATEEGSPSEKDETECTEGKIKMPKDMQEGTPGGTRGSIL